MIGTAMERERAEQARERVVLSERAARSAAEAAAELERRTRSEAEAAGSRLAFLADASELLSTSLDSRATLVELARLTVPTLADWCAVDILEDGQLRRLGVFHSDPQKMEMIQNLTERYPPNPDLPFGPHQVLRTGESEIYMDIPDDMLAASAHDDEHHEILRHLGFVSGMVVPLVARGRILGVMSFVSGESGRRYAQTDLRFAEELADRAALAVDNARLFEEMGRAELRFRSLVQDLDGIVWEAEPESMRFTFVSDRAERILGYPVYRWPEPGFWREMVHPDDREEVAEARIKASLQGASQDIEYRAVHADGNILWLREKIQEAQPVPGGRRYLRALAVDVTRMKRDELCKQVDGDVARVLADAASIQQAAPRLLEAIAQPFDWDFGALWGVDHGTDRLRCVDVWTHPRLAAGALAQSSRATTFEPGVGLPGRTWASGEPSWIQDLHQDTNFPRVDAALEDGLRAAVAFPIELAGHVLGVVELFAGERRPPEPDLIALLGRMGGQIGQFIERKDAERALRVSETRKTAILEASLDCVITIDHEGRVVEFNPAAERTFMLERDQVVGELLEELIVPERLRGYHREALRRLAEGGEPRILGQRIEMPAVRSDGVEIPCELAITRVDLPGLPLYTAFMRDITQRKRIEDALAFRQALLVSQNEATIDGILVTSADGESILYHNSRLADILAVPPESFQGGSAQDALRVALRALKDPERVTADILGRLRDPEAEAREEIELNDERILDLWTAPLRTEDGQLYGRAWYLRDMTDRKRTERMLQEGFERFEFLAEASTLLSASLDYDSVFSRVADLMVPRLADWCVVDVMQGDGRLRRVSVVHADPELHDAAQTLLSDPPTDLDESRSPLHDVLSSGVSSLWQDTNDRFLTSLALNQEQEQLLRALGGRSCMMIPLQARGRIFGVLTCVRVSSEAGYEANELALAEEIARRAALAADNARLYQDRAHVARTLQHGLLPPSLPDIPGLQVAACYRAAGEGMDVGGDFYDLFSMGDDNWAVVMGDVVGKGAEAASLTALARYTIRAAALPSRRSADVLTMLNDAILQQELERRFCTVSYARMHPTEEGFRLSVCCGGHPLPLVLRASGSIETAGVPGTVLGLFPDPELTEVDVTLVAGDTILFYTDGVAEVPGRDGQVLTDEMFQSLVQERADMDAPQLVTAIEQTVLDFQHGNPRDDIALLALRVIG